MWQISLALWAGLGLMIGAASSATAQATTRGALVVLRGSDTVQIERFNRGPLELTGSIEARVNGRTSRATYSVLRDSNHNVIRLESSLTVPQRGLSTSAFDVTRDSVIGPLMLAERESFFRGALAPTSNPLFTLPSGPSGANGANGGAPTPTSLAMLEDIATRARAAGAQVIVPTLSWGNTSPSARADTVTRVNDSTVTVSAFGGLRLTMSAAGRIIAGQSTTAAAADEVEIRSSPRLRLEAPLALMPIPNLRAVVAPPRVLAMTPPMGWNSWNRFGCRIDEQLIRETADALVSTGMREAGYRYLNIDDCWEAPARDTRGDLVADSTRFPSGMKALVDYIHSKGLQAGLYSSGGTGTCQRRPASLDHEAADAARFASWGFDYLKYDNCNAQNRPEQIRFKAMIDAVRATGHDMIISVCEWGEARPWLWAGRLGGQLWRTTEDIRDSWLSVVGILDQQVGLESFSGPGRWNDPDMLEVGNGKMTYDQYVAHFSLWALLNAPLIAGNDLRAMSDTTRSILLNRDVIAVDQDWGGEQGFRLRDDGASEVWAKPMSDGGWAVVLLNRGSVAAEIGVTSRELDAMRPFVYGSSQPTMPSPATVRDLWTGQTAPYGGSIRRSVPPTGAVMVRIQPVGR